MSRARDREVTLCEDRSILRGRRAEGPCAAVDGAPETDGAV